MRFPNKAIMSDRSIGTTQRLPMCVPGIYGIFFGGGRECWHGRRRQRRRRLGKKSWVINKYSVGSEPGICRKYVLTRRGFGERSLIGVGDTRDSCSTHTTSNSRRRRPTVVLYYVRNFGPLFSVTHHHRVRDLPQRARA